MLPHSGTDFTPDIFSDEQWLQLDTDLLESFVRFRSPDTKRAYRSDLARFRAWTGKPLYRVTRADFKSFAASIETLAPSTRYRILACVKAVLGYAAGIGHLPSNPAYGFRLKCVYPDPRILPEESIERMLDLELNPRNRAILALLHAAGLQVREICGLSREDLRRMRRGGTLYVWGKRGALGREIQLSAVVWKLLTALGAPVASGAAECKEPLFRSRKGKHGGRLKPLAIERIVRQAARRAGIVFPVSPKSLRQAYAAHALEHGTPLELVQANLGHASIATTARYRNRRDSRPSEPDQSDSKITDGNRPVQHYSE